MNSLGEHMNSLGEHTEELVMWRELGEWLVTRTAVEHTMANKHIFEHYKENSHSMNL